MTVGPLFTIPASKMPSNFLCHARRSELTIVASFSLFSAHSLLVPPNLLNLTRLPQLPPNLPPPLNLPVHNKCNQQRNHSRANSNREPLQRIGGIVRIGRLIGCALPRTDWVFRSSSVLRVVVDVVDAVWALGMRRHNDGDCG